MIFTEINSELVYGVAGTLDFRNDRSTKHCGFQSGQTLSTAHLNESEQIPMQQAFQVNTISLSLLALNVEAGRLNQHLLASCLRDQPPRMQKTGEQQENNF